MEEEGRTRLSCGCFFFVSRIAYVVDAPVCLSLGHRIKQDELFSITFEGCQMSRDPALRVTSGEFDSLGSSARSRLPLRTRRKPERVSRDDERRPDRADDALGSPTTEQKAFPPTSSTSQGPVCLSTSESSVTRRRPRSNTPARESHDREMRGSFRVDLSTVSQRRNAGHSDVSPHACRQIEGGSDGRSPIQVENARRTRVNHAPKR